MTLFSPPKALKALNKVVYVAGPFRADTPWEVERNVRRAELASKHLYGLGIPNICPHTMGRFLDKEIPDDVILGVMKALLLRCDGVLVVGSWRKSRGTMAEMALAEDRGKPIFYNIQDVLQWARSEIS